MSYNPCENIDCQFYGKNENCEAEYLCAGYVTSKLEVENENK